MTVESEPPKSGPVAKPIVHTDPKKRGLAGVHKARAMRLEGRFGRPSEKAWLGAGVALVVILAGYWFYSARQLSSAKDDLLGKRNAILQTVGVEWFALRDKLEHIAADTAGGSTADLVDPSAKSLSFQTMPGIYLRLRTNDAHDVTNIRKAAADSLKDGFTGCLLRSTNAPLTTGEPTAPLFTDQPWNLRQGYAATRILTDDWKHEVDDSSDSLRLRVFQQQYDKAVSSEIPIAIDIIKKARFFLLVEDDDSPLAAPGDAGKSTPETLQLVSHEARVVVYDLKKDALVVRLKRTAGASYMPAGDHPIADDKTRDAVQRQVNNCSLAQAVLAAIR